MLVQNICRIWTSCSVIRFLPIYFDFPSLLHFSWLSMASVYAHPSMIPIYLFFVATSETQLAREALDAIELSRYSALCEMRQLRLEALWSSTLQVRHSVLCFSQRTSIPPSRLWQWSNRNPNTSAHVQGEGTYVQLKLLHHRWAKFSSHRSPDRLCVSKRQLIDNFCRAQMSPITYPLPFIYLQTTAPR